MDIFLGSKCTKNGWKINKKQSKNTNDPTLINKKANLFKGIIFMEIIGKRYVSNFKIELLKKITISFIIGSTPK